MMTVLDLKFDTICDLMVYLINVLSMTVGLLNINNS